MCEHYLIHVTLCYLFPAPILQPFIVFNELSIEGFIVSRWADRWAEGINYNLKLIKEVRNHLKSDAYLIGEIC
jgi:Ni,Fe-hydrogenase I cytochrome b subunit